MAQMINVGAKAQTHRRAQASGAILLAPDAYAAIREGTNPKGDVLETARLAGIGGVKQTSQLLPLCHPLIMDHAAIEFDMDDAYSTVHATCRAETHARTGVEMEAMCGVQAALLCIYDMSKAVDPAITIGAARLDWKQGGKSGLWVHPDYKGDVPKDPYGTLAGRKCAVITLSDRAAAGEYEDKSGPALVEMLKDMQAEVQGPIVIPDDPEKLRAAIAGLRDEYDPALILTTGGTGMAPRDTTPETVRELFDREVPGIGELLRYDGAQYTHLSWASRSVAGLIGTCLVITLPGSSSAVREGFAALRRILPHSLRIAAGE